MFQTKTLLFRHIYQQRKHFRFRHICQRRTLQISSPVVGIAKIKKRVCWMFLLSQETRTAAAVVHR
ncbi:hypothetical protein Hanom_Chr16g01491701 [Helianthus anomalus]